MSMFEGWGKQSQKIRSVDVSEIVDDSNLRKGLFGGKRRSRKRNTAHKVDSYRNNFLEREAKELGLSSYETGPEDSQMLALANKVLGKYLEQYHIPFTPVLSTQIRRKVVVHNETKMGGQYNLATGTMHISPELDGFEHFVTLLHEMVHAAGVNKFIVVNKGYAAYRTGYELSKSANGKERRMNGFNEGIIEMIVREVIEHSHNDVVKELHEISLMDGGSEEKSARYEINYGRTGYDLHRSLITDFETDLVQLLHRREFGEETFAVPDDFAKNREKIVKGYFLGDMMHLRDIEKVFGPGSLHIVAALKWNDGYGTEKGKLFQKYIDSSASSWAEHLTIADEFLTDARDFARYVHANTFVRESVTASVKEPLPEKKSAHFERMIGLAEGMCLKIVTRLKSVDTDLAKKELREYTNLLNEAEEKRVRYMKEFDLNPNDVPVLTEWKERHLTIKPS